MAFSWAKVRPWKKSNKRMKGMSLTKKELLGNSSLYPVSQIGTVKSSSRKLWWTFVLMFGILGSGFEIAEFLTNYFQYPVTISLKEEARESSDFPAVTVCNLNRMKKNFAKCMEQGISLDNCIPTEKPSEGGGIVVSTPFSPIEPPIIISERRSFASCSKMLSGLQEKSFTAHMNFLTNYTALNNDDRKISSYQDKDFIADCSYNGENCKENFELFQSLEYGNCYTIRQNKINSRTFKAFVFSLDHKNGLHLVLDLNPSSYIKATKSFGARVIIHDPNEPPDVQKGINISPGFETSIGIRQNILRKLPFPYRDQCVNYDEDSSVRGKSRKDCVQICIQKQNVQQCSCIDPTLPNFQNSRHCNMESSIDACCLDKVLESMALRGLPCKCPVPCQILNYDIRVSRALWPSRLYECILSVCRRRSMIGLAKIKIYYSGFNQVIYEQIPRYHDSELFSNLGSLLSLWLGMSLFIAFEMVEKVILLFKYFGHRKKIEFST